MPIGVLSSYVFLVFIEKWLILHFILCGYIRSHFLPPFGRSTIIFFAALKRMSPSPILNMVFRYWSKYADNSSLGMESVRERVSMFTVQSLQSL